MYYAIFEFGELGIVPAVGGADEIAGDTLDVVDMMAVTHGTLCQAGLSILISAVHAAVTVMVDRAVTDVVFVHQIYDVADSLGVMGGVAIYLYIEDVAAAGELVIGGLDLGLMTGRTLVVDRHMVGVGVVDLVGHTGYHSKRPAVAGGELARESFGGSGEHREVVLIALREVVDARTHV